MSQSILMAIGGGSLAKADAAMEQVFGYLAEKPDPHVVVMTVATNEPDGLSAKFDAPFRKRNVKHVEMVNVWQRDDAFSEKAIEKVGHADAIFFTGGDQMNVTSLMGGSPLHHALDTKLKEGILLAGSSAGAAMMSSSMITSGLGDNPPSAKGVGIDPGMGMITDAIIDTHFSQRGRHGRLMTAVAHHPQVIGIGIDELTAIVVRGREFEVVGPGTVTVMDGSKMCHSDLIYREDNEPLGLFGMVVHVLPQGYRFNMDERQPIAPRDKTFPGAKDTD